MTRALPQTRRWSAAAFAMAFAAVAASSSRLVVQDTNLALYAGRLVARSGPPHTDTLTVAAHGLPWVDQQWLAQWVYYVAYRGAGYPGIALLSAAAIAAAFALLADILLTRGVSPLWAMMWSLIAFAVALPNTVIRAQSFAYPLFVLMVWLLLRDEARPRVTRWSFAVLPLLVLWANLHGSVLLAVPIVAAYAAWRSIGAARAGDRGSLTGYAALVIGAPLCILVTPYSPAELESYYRSVLSNPVIAANVQEWAPATFGGASIGFVLLLALVIGVTGYGIGRGHRPSLVLVGMTAALALAGVHAVRYQVWFAFPSVVLAADTLRASGLPAMSFPPRRLMNTVGAAAALVLGAAAVLAFGSAQSARLQGGGVLAGVVLTADAMRSPLHWPRLRRLLPVLVLAVPLCAALSLVRASTAQYEAGLPVQAADVAATYMAAHPGSRVMADEFASSSLLWDHPSTAGRVGFDPRFEIYPQARLAAWTRFLKAQGPDYLAVARGYQLIAVSTAHTTLVDRLHHQAGWTVIYDGTDGIVLRRS